MIKNFSLIKNMIVQGDFNKLRLSLSIKAKNGLDFILSAGVIWLLITFIWNLKNNPYDKSIFTFIVGGVMLPLALLFSKLLKTIWTDKENPLQPLGLWLNFAQLFYFPFLVLVLIKMPEYFVIVYAIITGAHFFPYAWFYKTSLYALFAGLISVGALLLGLFLPVELFFVVPLFVSILLFSLAVLLYFDIKRKRRLLVD